MDNTGGLSVVLLRDECSAETPGRGEGKHVGFKQAAIEGPLGVL